MKYLCKKDYTNGTNLLDYKIEFKKDNNYELYSTELYNLPTLYRIKYIPFKYFILDNKKGNNFIEEHFYSFDELRRLKIEKIKNRI